jgi:hypothetical protein
VPPDAVEAIRLADSLFLHALASFPERLRATRPQPGDWSATEVLAHVALTEREKYWPQLRAAVAHEPLVQQPTRGAQPERPAPFDEMLADYQAVRSQEIALLSSLPSEQWDTVFQHWTFGAVDIHWLARRMTQHTLDGAQQALMALNLLVCGDHERFQSPPPRS